MSNKRDWGAIPYALFGALIFILYVAFRIFVDEGVYWLMGHGEPGEQVIESNEAR